MADEPNALSAIVERLDCARYEWNEGARAQLASLERIRDEAAAAEAAFEAADPSPEEVARALYSELDNEDMRQVITGRWLRRLDVVAACCREAVARDETAFIEYLCAVAPGLTDRALRDALLDAPEAFAYTCVVCYMDDHACQIDVLARHLGEDARDAAGHARLLVDHAERDAERNPRAGFPSAAEALAVAMDSGSHELRRACEREAIRRRSVAAVREINQVGGLPNLDNAEYWAVQLADARDDEFAVAALAAVVPPKTECIQAIAEELGDQLAARVLRAALGGALGPPRSVRSTLLLLESPPPVADLPPECREVAETWLAANAPGSGAKTKPAGRR